MTHQSATGEHKVGTGIIKSLVDEEIFLLPSEIGRNVVDFRVKIASYAGSRFVNAVERTEKRSLIVKRLAGI